MAVIKRLSRQEIRKTFTHKGLFLGIVPVYLADLQTDTPLVTARNWIPEWYFDGVEMFFGLTAMLGSLVNPDWEPEYRITVTGEIN